jgi:hypothetical protein
MSSRRITGSTDHPHRGVASSRSCDLCTSAFARPTERLKLSRSPISQIQIELLFQRSDLRNTSTGLVALGWLDARQVEIAHLQLSRENLMLAYRS